MISGYEGSQALQCTAQAPAVTKQKSQVLAIRTEAVVGIEAAARALQTSDVQAAAPQLLPEARLRPLAGGQSDGKSGWHSSGSIILRKPANKPFSSWPTGALAAYLSSV